MGPQIASQIASPLLRGLEMEVLVVEKEEVGVERRAIGQPCSGEFPGWRGEPNYTFWVNSSLVVSFHKIK
jgi:hypothetical protein